MSLHQFGAGLWISRELRKRRRFHWRHSRYSRLL